MIVHVHDKLRHNFIDMDISTCTVAIRWDRCAFSLDR